CRASSRHDPGAINVPYPAWDKVVIHRPADKNTQPGVLLCQGVTCQMSPAVAAQGDLVLGHSNTKVITRAFLNGRRSDYPVTRPEFVKAALTSTWHILTVILDVRSPIESAGGHLKGAVNTLGRRGEAGLRASRPEAEGADHRLYGRPRWRAEAKAAAQALVKAARATQVMEQGLLGWQSADYAIERAHRR
ncbi:MAG: hypothetical protein IPM30_00005, partial [Burkholderiales bacterium]|nr:hypothetical protein [Burkholderiales bacterium]